MPQRRTVYGLEVTGTGLTLNIRMGQKNSTVTKPTPGLDKRIHEFHQRRQNSKKLQDITNSSTPKPIKRKSSTKLTVGYKPPKKIKLTKANESFSLAKISSDKTEKIIKEKLASNNYITTDSLKIPTICPLTKQKMKQPVRFKNCKHIECFDFWPYIETSKLQGYKPSQLTVLNATDDDLDDLENHPARKIVRSYIRSEDKKSNFKILEELKQQPTSIRNWISKTKISGLYEGEENLGVANVMICPICNDNLLVISDLELCEFTKKLIADNSGEQEIELELRNDKLEIKEKKKSNGKTSSKLENPVKFLETNSGNFYTVREEQNSKDIPVVHLDSF